MSGPLAGVRVLDLTRLLPGNYGTLLLADLGADVIKVEEPGRGDYVRWTPPLVDGQSTIHRALNRGKRSITLNLKAEGGAGVLARLAAGADALIESFRPGVMDRLGAGYEALSAASPRLVYCAITGYGQDGPYRDRVGHDINYIGYAGLLHAAGPPDGVPTLPPVQVGDLGGGMAAALGTVAAVLEARASGRGRFVDVSMLDVAASRTAVLTGWFLGTGEVGGRGALPLTGGLACYRAYAARDGRFLTVGALEPKFWRALCEAVGAPELIDRQFAPPGEQEEVAGRLQEIFATRDRDAWVGDLAGLEACVGPVNDADEALRDPQLTRHGLATDAAGRPVGFGPAIGMDRPADGMPAPALGEHTEEVLAEAGFGEDDVSDLRERGVL